jgi:hypothetical protein
MKRAYLFGAAALLILLIVVAYVSFSREKKDGGVCVRPPPPVVGPTADPVVRALVKTFTEEGDEEEVPLVLNRPKQKRDSRIGGPLPVDPLLQSNACMSPVLGRSHFATPGTPANNPVQFVEWTPTERMEARLFALEEAAKEMRKLPDIEDKLVGLEDEMLKMLEATGGAGPYQPADRTYDDELLMGDRLDTIEEERLIEY